MNIIPPRIHSNGSNKESLCNEYHEAYLDLQKAIRSFAKVGFNGRDYPLNFEKANEHREEMWNKLSSVSSYLGYHVDFLSK
jgi:hypothetical protein